MVGWAGLVGWVGMVGWVGLGGWVGMGWVGMGWDGWGGTFKGSFRPPTFIFRYQIVSHLGLVLQGAWQTGPAPSPTYSPLYASLASEEASSILIIQLVDHLHTSGDCGALAAVFSPLLQHCLR